MSIPFTCTCGKRMKAPDNMAGKKVKCGSCKKIVTIPYPACELDEARLALLRPFMASDDVAADPDGFPQGCVSKRAVAYACGAIARQGDTVEHTHSSAELELCRRLAAEAAGVAPDGTVPFAPFFIAANRGDKIVRSASEDFLRKKFGGVLSAQRPCVVEPLKEKGPWWEAVVKDAAGNESQLKAWRKLSEWFNAQRDFQEAVFVRIGGGPLVGDGRFPRLALGFTNDGSLAGIIGTPPA